MMPAADEDVAEVTEEALDSGKLWDEPRPKGGARVADDDLLDESVLLGGGDVEEIDDVLVSPVRMKKDADEDEDIADVTEEALDDELVTPKGRKSKVVAAAVEEVDEVEDLGEEEVVRPKTKAKPSGKSKMVVEEVEEEVEEEVLVKPGKKTTAAKKKVAVTVGADEEEEEEETPAPRGKKKAAPPARRRGPIGTLFVFTLRLVSFLAIVAVAGAAALWYFMPEYLEKIPPSPSDKHAPAQQAKWQSKPPEKQVPPAQAALGMFVDGQEKEAEERLASSEVKEEKAARGLMLFQKAMSITDKKEQSELLDTAVKIAEETESKELKNRIDGYKAQLVRLETKEKELEVALAKQVENDKILKAVIAELEGAKIKDADVVAGVKELAKQHEKLTKDAADLATTVKSLEKEKTDLTTTVKALEKDKTGLMDSVKTLQGEKGTLTTAIDQALAELGKGSNLIKPGLPKEEQIVEASKRAVLSAQSPLVTYAGQMSSSLGGLGSPIGEFFKRGLDSTTARAELAVAKTRQALSETPQQRLDNWVDLLRDRGRKDPAELKAVE
jgi:hypothetical protein